MPTFPNSTKLASPSYQSRPSTTICAPKGFAWRFFAPAHTYAVRPKWRFSSGLASRMTRASKPTPAMTANVTIQSAHVQLATLAREPDLDSGVDVLGNPEVRRKEVRGARRQDRDGCVGSGNDIDTALDHPITAPDEDRISALFERSAKLFGSLAALGNLEPEWIGDTVSLESFAQFREPPSRFLPECAMTATELMPGPGRKSTGTRAAASAARCSTCSGGATPTLRAIHAAKSATQIAPIPVTTPPATWMGWCSPGTRGK